MFSKSKIRKIVLLLLLFWYSVELAQAGEQIVLSPDGTNSNQNQINEAIEKAIESGGGTVYLTADFYLVDIVSPTGAINDQDVINKAIEKASESGGGTVYLTSGVYLVDGPVIIKSNVHLTGDPDAIIRVSSTSSQWFKGQIGVICNPTESVHNVEISGFQIDGNIANLPKSYANSRSDTRHDCEKLILIGGWSSNFGSNIKIHDMKLYNAFSDGIYIRFSKGVACYNNFISNCQHEGIFFSCVLNGSIYKNKIAGITSDCARLDNCQNCKIHDNIFFAYKGDSFGAYKGGHNGLQIGNAGVSHGYDARNKPFKTKNIEVFNNVFSDPGLRAIWLHSGTKNVYIHDNEFVNAEELITMGIPVGDISFENQPTVEMTEKVFDSIFDILEVEFANSGRTDQKAEDLPLQVVKKEKGIIAGGVKIVGFKDVIVLDDISYIPGEEAVLVQSKAIKNPDIEQFTGTIKKIDKDIDVELKDGKAYATMTVKTTWYTVKKNSVTGKNTKSKLKTSTATFKDSCQAPMVLERGDNVKAYINVYSDTKNPIAKLRIPHSNATQRIEVFYKDNSTTHTFLIGERLTDESGIQYTVFSRCELWEGTIPHMGNEILLIGKFDPAKLKIKYYTPYESFDVEDAEVIYHKTEEENYNMFLLKWIVQTILGLYAGYKIMNIAIN